MDQNRLLDTSKPLEVITRLDALLQMVKNKQNPPRNMDDILERMAGKGFEEISARTVHRHFDYLKRYFGIYVKYDHSAKQYLIDEDLDLAPSEEALERIINMVSVVGSMDKLLASSAQLKQVIRYEHEDSMENVLDNIKTALEAISKKKVVKFRYQSFKRDQPKEYELEPFVVAERNNRWYLVGHELNRKSIRTFGLDRITPEGIRSLRKPISKRRAEAFDYDAYFSQVVGIEFREGKPQKVLFRSTLKQAKYIESLPLHDSQTRLEDQDGYAHFQLKVVPTYELEMKLLSMGEAVEVLSPKPFRKKLHKRIKASLSAYETQDD